MFRRLILSILCGFILFISWPPLTSFTFLIFVAFVPLLILEIDVKKKEISSITYFLYSYLSFLIFNFSTTFWIQYAHLGGAIFAILCNSFFMAFIFYLYASIKNKIKWMNSIFILPILWLSFEYLHLNWDLSWPWLVLGNVFASHPNWIQWYSFTGVLGGTLWILLINLFFIRLYYSKFFYSILIIGSLLMPLLLSNYLYMHNSRKEKSNLNEKINVLIVQPNIDPYLEKFSISQIEQTNKMLNLVQPYIDSTINYLILPETFLIQPIWQSQFSKNLDIQKLNILVNEYTTSNLSLNSVLDFSSLNIIVGATTLQLSKKGATSKPLNNHKNQWYKVHNSVLHLRNELQTNGSESIYNFKIDNYHKSKLVPGAEQMPFQNYLYPILGNKILQIGSSNSIGNFSPQDSISLFSSFKSNTQSTIAPIICYESIYGEYVGEFVKRGAQAIFIITNDGWWKETSGYKQHNIYAKLRAIETRRYIARSANTGISSIINTLGEVEKEIGWNKKDVIKSSIILNNKLTFYVRHGDYLGRLSFFLSCFILLYFFVINKLHNSFK